MSKGSEKLTKYMQELLPGETVVNEHHIGERLMLDVYCDAYKLAAEYHGRQHFEYVEHFHGNLRGFKESQARDLRKEELCEELGIALVVFRYDEDLSKEAVFDRMLQALKNTEIVKEEKTSRYKGNPYYERQLERQREYRRKQYRRKKRWEREQRDRDSGS